MGADTFTHCRSRTLLNKQEILTTANLQKRNNVP